MHHDDVTGTNAHVLPCTRSFQVVDLEDRAGSVIERCALIREEARDVEEDSPADDRPFCPGLDAKGGSARLDRVVVHSVVESVPGGSAVPKSIDL